MKIIVMTLMGPEEYKLYTSSDAIDKDRADGVIAGGSIVCYKGILCEVLEYGLLAIDNLLVGHQIQLVFEPGDPVPEDHQQSSPVGFSFSFGGV